MPSPVYNNYANIITFSRGTNATLTDSTGKITYAPNNTLTYSQDFSNAAWLKTATGTGSTPVVTGGITAPDGTSTANKIVFAAPVSGDRSYVYQAPTMSSSTISYVGSFYVKADGAGDVGKVILFRQVAGGAYTNITLTASWQRVSSVETYASNNFEVGLRPSVAGSSGTVSINIWGAQLEPVTYQTTPSTYVATTTAAYYGPRLDYDPVTLAVKGMLVEEARTNLLLNSQDFSSASWTVINTTRNVVTDVNPSGIASSIKFTISSTASNEKVIFASSGVSVSAVAYTASVYAKAAELSWVYLRCDNGTAAGVYFNLANGTVGTQDSGRTGTITSVGNGWYRCTVTATLTAGTGYGAIQLASADNTKTFTGTLGQGILLWGAQFEAGSFATSYIPTTTASVARSADIASLSGTNFTGPYNVNAGTWVIQATGEYNISAATTTRYLLSNTNAYVFYTNINDANIRNYDGTNVASTAVSDFTAANKFASAYAGTTKNITANGGAVTSGTYNGTWANLTNIAIGNSVPAGGNQWNGWIKSITYYPRQLSSAQIQALTT